MTAHSIEALLKRLTSTDSEDAWREFLANYSASIYQVIRHFETDLDSASDCFQFVCERLVEKQCRKLRTFKATGPATFTTWLRAVTRNLCIDWRRKNFGRQRTFRSVSKLSTFDQEVFKLVYERGIPLDEALPILLSTFHNVTQLRLNQSTQRIESVLTPRQRWVLSQRAPTEQIFERGDSESAQALRPDAVDPRPSPEALAYSKERRKKLRRTLAELSVEDQLLIRMRFEQELTLEQLARMFELGNAQRADRRIKDVLLRLKQRLDQT